MTTNSETRIPDDQMEEIIEEASNRALVKMIELARCGAMDFSTGAPIHHAPASQDLAGLHAGAK